MYYSVVPDEGKLSPPVCVCHDLPPVCCQYTPQVQLACLAVSAACNGSHDGINRSENVSTRSIDRVRRKNVGKVAEEARYILSSGHGSQAQGEHGGWAQQSVCP